MFDINKIREDFPILQQEVNGFPLVYFDNAATSQKPKVVIDALNSYYTGVNSNVHRGAHTLADIATGQFEDTREAARQFINASSTEEVIFTKGTTEGINLVAYSFGRSQIQKGDEIIISTMEHHSNIVPWQMLCEEKGAILKVIPITDEGEIIFEEFEKLLSEKTKLVAVVHVSNALGTINPVERIIEAAHKLDVPVLVDGAQSSPHFDVDVQKMDCDFYVFSSHKVYGPTGMGVLYGKKALLEAMPPFIGGGEMIKEVSFKGTTFNELPFKFEAGTPNIADTIAMKKAFDYVNQIGKQNIADHENDLLTYATEIFESIDGLRIVGQAKEKVSVLSFLIDGIHAYDIGMALDATGIAIRTGHHCAQPLMERFGIEGTARASFAVYNTKEEVERVGKSLDRIASRFRTKISV
ncbi:cysteine desulfurase [Flammeovirgaceae bacterium SG7u.111]|nr:cysteine desulfurase [Flammeovirgaceae bacterium SG7u.132]WPO33635.1 cysteine desulfurase [Flammeovirgaceae bacterium SG7u.111]